jgi:hypothetical protein
VKRIRTLERELARKEQALAEAPKIAMSSGDIPSQ